MRDILMRQSADLLGQMYSKDIRAVTLDLDDPDECMSYFDITLTISRI